MVRTRPKLIVFNELLLNFLVYMHLTQYFASSTSLLYVGRIEIRLVQRILNDL